MVAAVLAYMTTVMNINVVDAFFLLKKKKKKKKKKDVSVSRKYLQAIQNIAEHGEKFEDVEKEIWRRVVSNRARWASVSMGLIGGVPSDPESFEVL